MDIVDCDQYRTFWISWDAGYINVGYGALVGLNEFMYWQDPEPNAVAYLSISGWSNAGDWEIIQFSGMNPFVHLKEFHNDESVSETRGTFTQLIS